jgi:hypothetical protein
MDGGIATVSRCLSGDKLALWMIERLSSSDVAVKVYETVKPLNRKCPIFLGKSSLNLRLK